MLVHLLGTKRLEPPPNPAATGPGLGMANGEFRATREEGGSSITGATDLVGHHGLQHLFSVVPPGKSDAESTYLDYARDLPGHNECVTDRTLHALVRLSSLVGHWLVIFQPPSGNDVAVRPFDHDTLISAFAFQPGTVSGFSARDVGADDLSKHIDDARREYSSNAHHTPNYQPPIKKPIIPVPNAAAAAFAPPPVPHMAAAPPPPSIKLKLKPNPNPNLHSNPSHFSNQNSFSPGVGAGMHSQSNGGSLSLPGSTASLSIGFKVESAEAGHILDVVGGEKKKKKKRKHEDDDANGIDDVNGEHKKKKKKKSKHSHHDGNEDMAIEID
ncbi:hypothetical protein BC830DRAFT_1169737 [Chytriomyces sp. MP71]|nr:hypothetical protein BC830DRAFT_1169737 [Chytriomyces sp. MP71]